MKNRTSRQVQEAIEASYHQNPVHWSTYHSALWLRELIEQRRAEIQMQAASSISILQPGQSSIAAAMTLLNRQANHSHSLADLQATLQAIEGAPEYPAAVAFMQRYYDELAAALAAEDAEVARLQAEAAELARKAEQADAEAQAKIAAAKGPVEKLREASHAIAARIREIRG